MARPSTRQPSETPEKLWTVSELAAAWVVGKNYIYDLIASGELDSLDLGHGRAKTRIRQSAVDRFLAARERANPKPQLRVAS